MGGCFHKQIYSPSDFIQQFLGIVAALHIIVALELSYLCLLGFSQSETDQIFAPH